MYLTTIHRIMIFKQKGWRVNLQPNKIQHHKNPAFRVCVCVCVPATSHLPCARPSTIQAMERMAWVLASRWSEKWYAFIMAVAQFSVGQRRIFFGAPKNGGFNRLEWG